MKQKSKPELVVVLVLSAFDIRFEYDTLAAPPPTDVIPQPSSKSASYAVALLVCNALLFHTAIYFGRNSLELYNSASQLALQTLASEAKPSMSL